MLKSFIGLTFNRLFCKTWPLHRNCYRFSFYKACKTQIPVETYFYHYLNLTLPRNKILATYVWIDGNGINIRSKDRVLNHQISDLQTIPEWSFDGSSTGDATTEDSDTMLIPVALYQDPFRKCPHVIVLCETYKRDGSPAISNQRIKCVKALNDISDQEPMFGMEQEYTMFDTDMWPLGWPRPQGHPATENIFSYCGSGEYVVGREIVESHARACLYAGLDFGGTNAEAMKSSWEFQNGTTLGIKAADDLWVARYILGRVAENFNVFISYHPKPMGRVQPGIGCHHNFSTKNMRSDGGITEIKRICEALCKRHEEHMKHYGRKGSDDNKKRLTGRDETPPYRSCIWAIADRSASIRIHRSVLTEKKGFIEDRRPAGDCDPYKVCASIAQTCV